MSVQKNLLVQKYQCKKLSFKKTKIAHKLYSRNLGARKFKQKNKFSAKKKIVKKNWAPENF